MNKTSYEKLDGLSVIVKSVIRLIKPVILTFGCYVIVHGHLSPGGGFPGGVLIAASFILYLLVYGKNVGLKFITPAMASKIMVFFIIGLMVIKVIGGGTFLKNIFSISPSSYFKIQTASSILVCNLLGGVNVGMCIFLVFVALSLVRVCVKEE